MIFRFQIPHSCNMKPICPYCNVVSSFENTPVYGDINQWWIGIQKLQEDYPNSRFCFVHGEPFSYLNLVSWMGMLSNKNIVDCISNLVNTYNMVIQYFIKPSNLDLTASYHPHYWKNIDIFYQEIEKIRNIGVNLNKIFLLGYPPYIKYLQEWENYFVERNLKVFLNSFNGTYRYKLYPNSYTEEERNIVLNNSFGKEEYVKSKGKLCNAGKDIVFIKWNGDISSCYGIKHYSLGNILTNNVKFLDKAMPCLNDICNCPDMFLNYLINED